MDKQLPAPTGSTGVDVDLLMRKVKRLEGERDDAIQALADEKKKTASMVRAIANLREILNPVHQGLRAIFGEIEAVGVNEVTPAAAAGGSAPSSYWDEMKKRWPGKATDIISVLLLQKSLNATQLAHATRSGINTVYKAVEKMVNAGVVQKSGKIYSLIEPR